MAIQSSINSLLSQSQSLAAFYKGFEKAGDLIKGQEAQTEATKKLQESFEERFRKAYNIDKNTPLTHDQNMAVKFGAHREARLGSIVEPGEAVRWVRVQKLNAERMQSLIDSQRVAPEVKNEIASDLARGSVEARTASINKTKSNFDEHTASLIKYYSKGSGNP